MSVIPVMYKCEECGVEDTGKDNFPHAKGCPLVKEEIFINRKELLIEWLMLELPPQSMAVYDWPGLNQIAHNLLLYINNSSTFSESRMNDGM